MPFDRILAETEKPPPGPVPKEALRYFKTKGLKPGFRFTSVWQQEHTFGFTVAKLMEIDLLADIRKATEKALEEGKAFEDWKKEALPTLEKSGWRSHVSDKALPHRLKVIFETNMRVARAVGQEERAQRTKKILPFMVFELGPSKVHRDEHASWAGTALSVDDDWWKLHTPPLGFGCKCRKRQISKREAERIGVKDAPADEMIRVELPDGRSGSYPKGVHPAFAYPKDGKARAASLKAALKAAGEDDSEETSFDATVVALFKNFMAWMSRGGDYDRKATNAEVVREEMTEWAKTKLVELVELCPGPDDRTGVHKFAGCAKHTKMIVEGELTKHGLVTKNKLQKRRPFSPTLLGREVYALIKGAK